MSLLQHSRFLTQEGSRRALPGPWLQASSSGEPHPRPGGENKAGGLLPLQFPDLQLPKVLEGALQAPCHRETPQGTAYMPPPMTSPPHSSSPFWILFHKAKDSASHCWDPWTLLSLPPPFIYNTNTSSTCHVQGTAGDTGAPAGLRRLPSCSPKACFLAQSWCFTTGLPRAMRNCRPVLTATEAK